MRLVEDTERVAEVTMVVLNDVVCFEGVGSRSTVVGTTSSTVILRMRWLQRGVKHEGYALCELTFEQVELVGICDNVSAKTQHNKRESRE